MVGVALVGVLAAIAYPSYQAQIARGRVAQAVNDIGELSIQLERYFTEKGKFPASLAAAGLARNDPWGNAYQYLNMDGANVGQVRKDKSLHPLNTDYDLYSKGADGASVSALTAKASHDDVIRGNNGGFIGLAEKY